MIPLVAHTTCNVSLSPGHFTSVELVAGIYGWQEETDPFGPTGWVRERGGWLFRGFRGIRGIHSFERKAMYLTYLYEGTDEGKGKGMGWDGMGWGQREGRLAATFFWKRDRDRPFPSLLYTHSIHPLIQSISIQFQFQLLPEARPSPPP